MRTSVGHCANVNWPGFQNRHFNNLNLVKTAQECRSVHCSVLACKMNVISEVLGASGDRAAPHSVWSVVWCHSAGSSEATDVGVVGAVGTALLCSAVEQTG